MPPKAPVRPKVFVDHEKVGAPPIPIRRGDNTKYTASWKVKDENSDTLQFNVYYKGVIDETNWKLLKKELEQDQLCSGHYLNVRRTLRS